MISTGILLSIIKKSFSGQRIAMSASGTTLAFVQGNGTVKVLDLNVNQIGQDINPQDPQNARGLNGYVTGSMNAAGNRLAIGGLNVGYPNLAGYTRVYELNNSTWTRLGQDIPFHSTAVSLNAAGNIICVGAENNEDIPNKNQARVYQLNNSTWTQIGQTIEGRAALDQFDIANDSRLLPGSEKEDNTGASVSINASGDRIAVGSPYVIGIINYGLGNTTGAITSGKTTIYSLIGNTWTQTGQVIIGQGQAEGCGGNVSLNDVGDRILVSTSPRIPGENGSRGKIRIFQLTNNQWTQLGQDITGKNLYESFGRGKLNATGNKMSGSGAGLPWENKPTRIYSWNGISWTQMGSDIMGSGDLAKTVDTIPITDNSIGQTNVFLWDGNSWIQI